MIGAILGFDVSKMRRGLDVIPTHLRDGRIVIGCQAMDMSEARYPGPLRVLTPSLAIERISRTINRTAWGGQCCYDGARTGGEETQGKARLG